MNIDRKLLKEELLKSPFLDLAKAALKPNDEIIAVQLAGSHAAKLNTDKSDIDISVLTLKSWNLESDVQGTFQGSHLHWWVCPFDFHIIPYATPHFIVLHLAGAYYMSFDPENYIWINPKYTKLIEYLRNSYQDQKLMIACKLIEAYRKETLIWKTYEKFPIKKTHLPLIEFYYEKNNLTRNSDLLLKAKQILTDKSIKLTVEEQAEARKALLWTVDYCDTLDYNYKLGGLDWQVQAEKIIEDCKNNNE